MVGRERVSKLLSAAAVLIAAVMLLSSSGFSPQRRYDMRQDLGVYLSNADSVIDNIRGSLRRRSEKITICFSSHSDNMSDIDELVSELMTFARGETERPDEGDYIAAQLGGYEARYEYSLENGIYSYTIVISPDYYTDAQQESRVDERVKEIIGQLNIGRHSPEIERVRAVYCYLIENVGYDEVHKNNAHYHLKSTAYGALVNKRAVCQGYAVAAYRLFRELGLDCRVITGTASDGSFGEEYHAWNIVRVDGRYYNLDITWDKRLGTDRYFLKCESDFDSHKRDGQFTGKAFDEMYPMSETSYML